MAPPSLQAVRGNTGENIAFESSELLTGDSERVGKLAVGKDAVVRGRFAVHHAPAVGGCEQVRVDCKAHGFRLANSRYRLSVCADRREDRGLGDPAVLVVGAAAAAAHRLAVTRKGDALAPSRTHNRVVFDALALHCQAADHGNNQTRGRGGRGGGGGGEQSGAHGMYVYCSRYGCLFLTVIELL